MSKVKKCVGKESFLRMNYLYQMSNLFATNKKGIPSNFYSNLVINISKKTVQRLDIDIKRTICKACRNIVIPGVSCKVRLNRKKLYVTCLLCGTSRSFNVSSTSNNVPWSHNPDALVECLDYSQNRQN